MKIVIPDRLVAGRKILALLTVVRIHLREFFITKAVFNNSLKYWIRLRFNVTFEKIFFCRLSALCLNYNPFRVVD